MTKYITKEQALQAVRDAVDAKEEAIHAIGVYIDALNVTDVAPVVYCKDCKYLKYQRGVPIDGGFFEVTFCPKLHIQVIDNFYCALGRHKERV